MTTNPMVPDRDWRAVAEGFRSETGKQTFLCGYCVAKDGNISPPAAILVYGGYSLCLDHFPVHQAYMNRISSS